MHTQTNPPYTPHPTHAHTHRRQSSQTHIHIHTRERTRMSSHVVQPLSCTLVVHACRALVVKMAGAEHIDENRAEIVAETDGERRERQLRQKEASLEKWICRCEKKGIAWQEELDRQAEERRREKEKKRRQRETELDQKRQRLERLVGPLWPFPLKMGDLSQMSLE